MTDRVWVAGHRGMVGSAVVRRLASEPVEVVTATRGELDLLDQAAVMAWMRREKPDAIVLAAAKVGGILANDTLPVAFLYENLTIQNNIIHAAHACDVDRLVFLGSSCIYPKFADQPIREDALLTGALEPTNEWYAIAKIAGLKLCQAYRREFGRRYISVMPCNLYGPHDNFDLDTSHVLPALIRKIHEAKIAGSAAVVVWGTGTPRREFLHVDDLADAVVFLLENYNGDLPINCGSHGDVTITELATLAAKVVGFTGRLVYDPTKPDGTPRKLMDSSRMKTLGWTPRITLEDGIEASYAWFEGNQRSAIANPCLKTYFIQSNPK